MKKILTFAAAIFSATAIFAASYTNNTYQVLATEYMQKAAKALDAGEYALAEEYAAKAQENADLSDAFIRSKMQREFAEKDVKEAKSRLEYVKSINGEQTFPVAVEAAEKSLAQAEDALAKEDYESASAYAKQVMDTLAEVQSVTPLPKYYIVKPWAQSRDCFWNIAGRSYVYNNPFLWENLYEKNKDNIPEPGNPNLILPGMKMEIPSISGEYRDGIYSADKDYETFVRR